MHEFKGSDRNDSPISLASKLGNDTNLIESSWRRCKDKYKIAPQCAIELCTLTEKEIREKREPLDQLLVESHGMIERIRRVAEQSGYSVVITNAEGVTVKAFTDSDHGLALQSRGIRPGTLWQEAIVGTNGVGTCLEEKRPIIVDANEHYGTNLQCFTCSAAPLIGADGAVFGALDMSTFANGNRLGQALALNFVTETANEIEALIFRDAYRNQHIINLEGSVHKNTALVAFNDSGTIVAATTLALMELRCGQRYDLVGKNVQDAFQITWRELFQSAPIDHQFELNGNRYHFLLELHPPEAKRPKVVSREPLVAKPVSQTTVASHPDQYLPLFKAAGKDPALIHQAKRCIRIVDRGVITLLQGETGTGKEVWAKALHDSSSRKSKPFVAVNCAAIPETLIESELFGYGAGTFTGGLKSGKKGKIEASNGGTLFLDEIGDMPAELQARLLRVLAEKEIIPLGEVESIPIDINVICATHRDLEHYVSQGDFREDLFYRISVFKVALPGLRERQDKSHLIRKVLDQLRLELGETHAVGLSTQAEQALLNYLWPGNIRQLKNVLHCAACMREGNEIQVSDLPEEVLTSPFPDSGPVLSAASPSVHATSQSPEKQQLIAALESHRWNITRAAKALGVSRSTLHRKIKSHDLLEEPLED